MHVSINSCEAERENLIIKNKIQLEERLNYLFRCSTEHGSTKLLSYEEITEYAAKNREKIDQAVNKTCCFTDLVIFVVLAFFKFIIWLWFFFVY